MALVAYLTVLALLWVASKGIAASEKPPTLPDDQLVITYGFSRQTQARTFTVDIPPPSTTAQSSSREFTVRLAGDLRRKAEPGEFPASQMTVGSSGLRGTQIILEVTANPWTPDKVPPGLYTGTIQVRGPGAAYDIPLNVWLQSRERRWAGVAFSILFLGALLGLLVKWITERLTPQAALVRRVMALKRAIGYHDDGVTLPVGARMQVEELEDQIARSDLAKVQTSFDELEKDKSKLAAASWRFGLLIAQLDAQARLLNSSPLTPRQRALVESVLDAELRYLQDIQAKKWPTKEPEMAEECDNMRGSFATIHNMIAQYIEDPSNSQLRRQLMIVQQGVQQRVLPDPQEFFMEDTEAIERDAIERDAKALAVPYAPRQLRPAQAIRAPFRSIRALFGYSEQPVGWLYRYARSIAGVASVLIVSLVGLKTQYLDNQPFNGSLTDWLGLGLWGAVVELSGVSILDVVGRLGSDTGSTQPGRT